MGGIVFRAQGRTSRPARSNGPKGIAACEIPRTAARRCRIRAPPTKEPVRAVSARFRGIGPWEADIAEPTVSKWRNGAVVRDRAEPQGPPVRVSAVTLERADMQGDTWLFPEPLRIDAAAYRKVQELSGTDPQGHDRWFRDRGGVDPVQTFFKVALTGNASQTVRIMDIRPVLQFPSAPEPPHRREAAGADRR